MKAESIEKIILFLKDQGIKTNYEQAECGKFNRVIEFEVKGTWYFISWYINQSYLKLRKELNTPFLPFTYIAINGNSPTTKHRLQLCFYDQPAQGDKDSCFYNPLPFGAFKIPFNINI